MMPVGVAPRVPFLLALGVTFLLGGRPGRAEAPSPARPKQFDVQLRYRIYAGRNERVRQYYELIDHLKAIGFNKNPGEDTEPEDPSESRMTGTIAAAAARKLLDDAHVKTILLAPAGYQLPADGDVKVRIELAGGYPAEKQLQLYEQSRDKLATLGFRENVGHDNRGHTRLLGTIPASDLDSLLKDLRTLPAGWLAPQTPPAELPQPLRGVSPVRVVEVIPNPEAAAAKEPPAEAPAAAQGEAYLRKITPDLNELSRQEGATAPRRLEVILTQTPPEGEKAWQRQLIEAVPGLVVEGRLGPLVTVLAPPKLAPALAELGGVSTVRLPVAAEPPDTAPRATAGNNTEALRASGVERLHALGHRGKGIRIAIIDGDFRGYQAFIGKGHGPRLPTGTRYVDLTAERNVTVEPDPFPGEAKVVGHGTRLALAAALAAPDASIVLVRVDPAAPYQLQEIARYMHGEGYRSNSYAHRHADFENDQIRLRERKQLLLEERKVVLEKFTDTSERERLAKKPAEKLTEDERGLLQEIKRYDAYFAAQAEYDRDEEVYRQRTRRFMALERDLRGLRDVRVAVCGLLWDVGHALGGESALTRYFDEQPFRTALWFQAAGDTRGQAWSGVYRDDDGNGVLEFAGPDAALPAGRWTRELNFLAWQPHGQATTPDVPVKAKLRLTLQWRESHDPEIFRHAGDRYREPVAKLRLVVLRQRDPQGAKLPGDDLEVVARSEGLPQRLENHPTYAVYEQAVEFTPEAAGRFALRVEGRVPTDIRPADEPTLPAQQQGWEMRPRIFVDTADTAARAQGRPVFLDFATELGTVGVPADARQLLTVGAAGPDGQPRAYSAGGPPLHMELHAKPDLFSFDGLQLAGSAAYGTDQAAAFAAGAAAAAFSAGMRPGEFVSALRERSGQLLRVR